MRMFLVGGFVRDHLMGMFPNDRDYVVTGATEDELMAKPPFGIKSFSKVGAEFPVFLSDQGDEWALARRERKTGHGYHGFEVDFGPEVTLADGTQVKSLDGNLLQKFIDAGFSLDEDYDVGVLIQFFQQTNQ